MKFGVHIPHAGQIASPEAIGAVARRAETLGYESIWTVDHIVVPAQIESSYPGTASGRFVFRGTRDFYEPLPVMAYLAAITERVKIGVSVLVIPYRNPVVTAKQLATIDALSHGRLILGVGVGWMPEEFAALQTPPFAKRGAVTDEYLDIFQKLWSGEVVRHDGQYYQFEPIQSNPKPVNPSGIPIWVGGYTGPAYRRTARFGAAWHGINFGPATIGEPIAAIAKAAEAAGRRAADIALTVRLNVDASGLPLAENPLAATDRGRTLLGTADEMVEEIRAYERAGVSEILLAFPARDRDGYLEQIELFARDVVARLG